MSRRPRPRPPLPQREGLDPVRWVVPPSTPPRPALVALRERFPALASAGATDLAERFARGDMVRSDGTAWSALEEVRGGDALWFHREHAPEDVPEVELPILHQDEHLLVIDKPHGIATTPRGAHILGSALARLRRATGIAELSPLHRLDRRTAGVLAFGVRPEERAAYQGLFAQGRVRKEYRARVVPARADRGASADGESPTAPALRTGERFEMTDRLEKPAGSLAVQVVPGAANARTDVEVLETDEPRGSTLLALRPRTGRTHQLRAQLAARGLPILGDDLYPVVRELGESDPPLQLLALELAFTDPITRAQRCFRSRRRLVP